MLYKPDQNQPQEKKKFRSETLQNFDHAYFIYANDFFIRDYIHKHHMLL